MMGLEISTIGMIVAYFFVGLLGVIAHFFKQKVRGQTPADIKAWFGGHFKDTILSMIAFVVTFAWLVSSGDVTFMSAFMSGYMCDSLFSRVEKKNDVQ